MEIRRAVQTGRILFLPMDKCDLFAEEFLSYIDEGFCPVFYEVVDGQHLWDFAGYEVSDDGVVITAADTDVYTLPYKASQSDEGESDTVTVTFDPLGMTGDAPSPITVEKGDSITLPEFSDAFWVSGVKSEIVYCEGDTYTVIGSAGESYTPTSDITLYALEEQECD